MTYSELTRLANDLGGRSCSPDPKTIAFDFNDLGNRERFAGVLREAGVRFGFWSGAVAISVSDTEGK